MYCGCSVVLTRMDAYVRITEEQPSIRYLMIIVPPPVLVEKAIRVTSSRSPVGVLQAAQHRSGPHWPCRTRILQRIRDLLV
jgi:hypothetical protein